MKGHIAIIICLFLIVVIFSASTAMVVGIFELKVITSSAEIDRAGGGQVILFEMEDPEGDDYGPGTYTYPTHDFFSPYKGLFDMTRFVVSFDASSVYFDITFKEIQNPLDAEEGFTHQLIDIYISTGHEGGRTETLKKGAYVTFDPKHPWNLYIRGGPWQISRFYTQADDGMSQGLSKGIRTELLPDGKTIRIAVDKGLTGEPSKGWKYYVLVGSQDGFGPDEYRPVMERATGWDFGGGRDDDFDPNVIDMLAPPNGRHSQEKMLSSFNPQEGRLATISPVGPGGDFSIYSFFYRPEYLIALVAIILLVYIAGRVGLINRVRGLFKGKDAL